MEFTLVSNSPRQRDRTPVGIVLEPRTSLLMLMPIARWARAEVLLCVCQRAAAIAIAYCPHLLFPMPKCIHFTIITWRPSQMLLPCWALHLLHRGDLQDTRGSTMRDMVHASIDSGFFVRLASPIERCAHIKSRPGISRADTCRGRASPSSTPDTPQ